MPKETPILISHEHDITTAALSWALSIAGYEPIWINNITNIISNVTITNATDSWQILLNENDTIFGNVWFRRPGKYRISSKVNHKDYYFIENEWKSLVDNIHILSDCLTYSLWINNPRDAFIAENKMLQLSMAKKCGLKIPNTLISNNKEYILDFYNQNKYIIYKPFRHEKWIDKNSNIISGCWASVMNDIDKIDSDSFDISPGIYQQYIKKKTELRAIIIGNNIYCVSIESHNDEPMIDWRPEYILGNVIINTYDLPIETKNYLLSFMSSMNLKFGCVDLILDDDNNYYFLEVNQGGQFLFIEYSNPNISLLLKLTEYFIYGNNQSKLDSCHDISYVRFTESPYFDDWNKAALKYRGYNNILKQAIIE